MKKIMNNCAWSRESDDMLMYHDREWGRAVHNDITHFEYLSLEAMQCGLSWAIVFHKRELLNKVFDGFDFKIIADYDDNKVKEILETEGMICSERKIRAIINNAKMFVAICDEYGSFDKFIWSFTDGKTIVYRKHAECGMPSSNSLSDNISLCLKKMGFKYLGSVTVYSYLQACGIINDHYKDCPSFEMINKESDVIYVE